MANAFEPEAKQSFIEFTRALRRDRDRVRVQLNLAQKEIHDEWEKIEDKWDDLERAVANISNETAHVVHEVGDDIKSAYRKLEREVLNLD